MQGIERILNQIRNNPYKQLTEEERQELKEIELSVKRDVRELIRISSEIVQDQRYAQLKKEYDRVYEKYVRLMIYLEEPDPIKYAFKMKEYATKLRDFEKIVHIPESFVEHEQVLNKKKT